MRKRQRKKNAKKLLDFYQRRLKRVFFDVMDSVKSFLQKANDN